MAIKKQEKVFNFLKDNIPQVNSGSRLKGISRSEYFPKKYSQRLGKGSLSNLFLCH